MNADLLLRILYCTTQESRVYKLMETNGCIEKLMSKTEKYL